MTWTDASDAARWCQVAPGLRWYKSDAVCRGLTAVMAWGTDFANAYLYDSSGKLAAVISWTNGIRQCRASDLPDGGTPMLHTGSAAPETPAGPGCDWAGGSVSESWTCSDGGVEFPDAGGD